MWIGLLWYFNFVQIPNMAKIPDGKNQPLVKLLRLQLYFGLDGLHYLQFVGLILAYINGYVHDAMTLGITSGGGKSTAIGIGMWFNYGF